MVDPSRKKDLDPLLNATVTAVYYKFILYMFFFLAGIITDVITITSCLFFWYDSVFYMLYDYYCSLLFIF